MPVLFLGRKTQARAEREKYGFPTATKCGAIKNCWSGGKGKDHAEGFFPSFPLSALGGGNGVSRHEE